MAHKTKLAARNAQKSRIARPLRTAFRLAIAAPKMIRRK
jgi:hypothetical protein